MQTLLLYGDTSVIESVEADFFNYSKKFGSDEGLKFAFGVVDTQGNFDISPDYGQIVARYEVWGWEAIYSTIKNEIPVKQCTLEELGLSEGSSDASNFYPIKPSLKY